MPRSVGIGPVVGVGRMSGIVIADYGVGNIKSFISGITVTDNYTQIIQETKEKLDTILQITHNFQKYLDLTQ